MNERQRRSRQQEEKSARDFHGQRSPGSGNGWSRKGDVRAELLLIENKRTDAKQITLKSIDLVKIKDEALAEGRVPALQFELLGHSYVVLTQDDFMEYCGDLMGPAGMGT